jgi:hypothetical protein
MSRKKQRWSGKVVYTKYHECIICNLYSQAHVIIHLEGLITKIIQLGDQNIAIIRSDNCVHICNVNSGEIIQTITKDNVETLDIFEFRNGDIAVEYDSCTIIWNRKTQKVVKELPFYHRRYLYLQDGTLIGWHYKGIIEVLDSNYNVIKTMESDRIVTSVFETSPGIIQCYTPHDSFSLWNVSTGELIEWFSMSHEYLTPFTLINGNTVRISKYDFELHVFNTKGDKIRTITGFHGKIMTEAEPYVLACQNMNNLVLWDIQTAKIVRQFVLPENMHIRCILK